MSGAEKLLGKGDMLYYPVGSSKPQRVQGAFIGDDEVEAVVDAVKNQFDAFTYNENLLNDVSSNIATPGESSNEDDEHMAAAIDLVVDMEQASISMLQRKFKIGYNRAARLIDEMEERGIVGPSQGSKPRTVLINRSDLQ
jgi:S-DNA-T family DNA segregation ATPase FtsK/SpoIIIE